MVKDEIKPLEASAVAYIKTSLAVQRRDGFSLKGERNNESRNSFKNKERIT